MMGKMKREAGREGAMKKIELIVKILLVLCSYGYVIYFAIIGEKTL